MVTVSATAVGVPFGDRIAMPSFSDWMPTGVTWGITCVVLGAVMTVVAVKGYAFVARVGHIAAPWMFLVFVACGVVVLGRLGTANLFELIRPPEGTEPKISFWGIVAFSWFCNAAMHLGMSDLSVLRYARKPGYGWASAAGMFLGHYVAWICAALLLVYWVREFNVDPATGVAPGPMVFDAVGWAGLLCVVVAGWTTANPTIYRRGDRGGPFPGRPRGDDAQSRRENRPQVQRRGIDRLAVAGGGGDVSLSLPRRVRLVPATADVRRVRCDLSGTVEVGGAPDSVRTDFPMRKFAKPLALLALAATIVPPLLFAGGALAEAPMKWTMLLGAVLWFAASPFWLKEND
jgi:hypothetical protein